jgi:hypothetical protein
VKVQSGTTKSGSNDTTEFSVANKIYSSTPNLLPFAYVQRASSEAGSGKWEVEASPKAAEASENMSSRSALLRSGNDCSHSQSKCIGELAAYILSTSGNIPRRE